MEGETVYGSSEDSQSVMSERVQTLARNIYQEFQRMIQKYDEDVVKVSKTLNLVTGFVSANDPITVFIPLGTYATHRQYAWVPRLGLHW